MGPHAHRRAVDNQIHRKAVGQRFVGNQRTIHKIGGFAERSFGRGVGRTTERPISRWLDGGEHASAGDADIGGTAVFQGGNHSSGDTAGAEKQGFFASDVDAVFGKQS